MSACVRGAAIDARIADGWDRPRAAPRREGWTGGRTFRVRTRNVRPWVAERLRVPRYPSGVEGVQSGVAGQLAAVRAHFADRWVHAARFGVIVGAPLAAGVAAGGASIGAIAATAALLNVLLGPPGHGTARRAQVTAVAVLVGLFGAIGAVTQLWLWLTVPVLLALGVVVAVGRVIDRAAATVLLAPLVALLVGTGARANPQTAVELLIAAAVGGLFVLLLDRVWPSPEHPAAALEGHVGRMRLVLLALAPAVVYALAAQFTDLPANALAFGAWALLLIGGTGPLHRRGQAAFLVVGLLAVALAAVDARRDVLVFITAGVAAVGAWRAARGVLPLWSVLAVILLILIGTGG